LGQWFRGADLARQMVGLGRRLLDDPIASYR